jgi:hypothetical protein
LCAEQSGDGEEAVAETQAADRAAKLRLNGGTRNQVTPERRNPQSEQRNEAEQTPRKRTICRYRDASNREAERSRSKQLIDQRFLNGRAKSGHSKVRSTPEPDARSASW